MSEENTMVQALVQGLTRSIGAALVAVLLCACGGGGGAAAHNKPNPAPTTAGYGITARVVVQGHPEQSGWVRVPPVDWQSWSNQADVKTTLSHPPLSQPAPGPKSQSVSGPPRHVEATVQGSDGGVTDTVAQDANLNFAPGWSLLYWATTACYQPTAAPDPSSEASSLLPSLFVDTAPWRILRTDPTTLRDYYIFGDGAGNPDGLSCDAQLLMQETLLCAADHLAQLGDSPGTVTWSGSDGASNPATITVTIPPQRSDDIFIARDMALNALAHLLRLDTESRVFDQQTHTQAGVVPFQSTCIAEYGKAPLDSDVSNVFSVSGSSTYFDPVPLSSSSSATDFQAAGKLRLTRKANLLTSAARLVKDLLERSVQDDISGAQQRLSSSTDALSGAELAWGADPKGDPYNTLHHALRTLFGRLEIGNYADPRVSVSPMDSAFNGSSLDWIPHQVTRDDPECGPFSAPPYGFGVTALNEFFSLPSVSARWDDAPPKTPTQSLALSILDQAGIVAPPSIVQLVVRVHWIAGSLASAPRTGGVARREPAHPAPARWFSLSIGERTWSMGDMQKRYIINLSGEERAGLEALTRGRASAQKRQRARILLKVDGGLTDAEIAEELEVDRRTVERLRERCCTVGLEAAVEHKKPAQPPRMPILDGEGEARLVQIACSTPPDGRAKWTLSLLADKLVELQVVDSVSRTTVCRRLKKKRAQTLAC